MSDKTKEILDSLAKGNEGLEIANARDVVLVLGGAPDKLSFIRFIVGGNPPSVGLRSAGFQADEALTVPKLFVDTAANGTAIYDCPRLGDWSTEAEDVSAAFFTRKLIRRAESAKLILVVDYDSLNRSNFEQLLSKTSTFIKNVNAFRGSIGIVVTSAEASASEERIHNRLSSVHKEMLNKGKTGEADLLSALLAPGKIVVWKTPETAETSSNGRDSLRKLVHQDIHFAAYNKDDFGIVLSDNSRRHLTNLAEEITKNIGADAVQIGEQFADFYRSKENKSRDVDGLLGLFYKVTNDERYKLDKFKDWSGIKDPKGFVSRSLEILEEMDMYISKERLLSVLNSDEYLEFVEAALGRPARRQINWAGGFNAFVRYLDNSCLWYQNLANLQNVDLCSSKTQANVEKYKKAADEMKAAITSGGDFSKSFRQFLEAFRQPEGIIRLVMGLDVDARKKELLREVVEITLDNHSNKPKCAGNKLTVSGQFVSIGDVEKCTNDKDCCKNPKEVEIFATHKVFFDKDIDWTGKEVQLSIIAPTWEVIGKRRIVLDGKSGEAHKPAKEGPESNRPGSSGKPGAPGLPGGPAGGLVAIGQRCVACVQLKITLIGGNGGPGQDGGDGRPGKDGERPNDPELNEAYKNMPSIWEERGFRHNCRSKLTPLDFGVSTWDQWCTVYGNNGKYGGNGGDGGKGGVSGAPGKLSIVFVENHGFPVVITGDGLEGAKGKGGLGGTHGKKGDNLEIHVQKNNVFLPINIVDSQYVKDPRCDHCSPQPSGTDGRNSISIKPSHSLQYINPSFPINNYKAFLRQNLNKSLQISYNFLESLGTNDRVANLYDTMGLVNDMQLLEEQFQDIQNELDVLPHYANLQERIAKYSGNLESKKENDDDHKMVLSYLYSAVLSKIRNINNNMDEGLVVNIAGRLNSLKTDITKLKQVKEAVNKNMIKQAYQESFKSKTEDAKNFISGIIEPEIKNAINKTESQIDSLIDETLALQVDAKKERDQILMKQHRLEGQLVLRYILGAVEVVTPLLALAGPVGSCVGGVIGVSNQVAQGLLLTEDGSAPDLSAVPKEVERSLAAMTEHLKKKEDSFKQRLADAKELIDKVEKEAVNDSIKAVKEKIQETQKMLKTEMEKDELDPESTVRMYKMQRELANSLDKEKSLLEKDGKKSEKTIDLVGKLKTLVEVGDTGLKVYGKIKKSEGAIEKLGATLQKSRDSIAKLELQEQNIYKTIIPMVKGISGTLQNLRAGGSSKSSVALDVSKWQIQNGMREVSKRLKEMTQGYKSQGELAFLMDKVEHGMTTMIQVYDRIQEFQKDAEFADYLSQISQASTKVGNIKDAALKSAADYLEMNMHFNMVLSEYGKAIDALKHSVFPFAKRYLKAPEKITSKFKFETSASHIENVVNRMSAEFDELSKQLGKDEDYLYLTEKYINPDQYYMRVMNSYPFYSWEFTGQEDIVGKLFKGEEIVLAAAVTDEQVEKLNHDAIKFNQIGINVVLADDQSQARIGAVLAGFKVNMTHLGQSHYECGSKSYAIAHDHETIQHSFNKRNIEQGKLEYYHGNQPFKKLKNSKPLLSPYTTWRINLFVDASARGLYSFSNLTEFTGRPITLELEGTGQYVMRSDQVSKKFCNRELDQFYQRVKTSAIEDNVDVRRDVEIREILAGPGGERVRRSRRSIRERFADASRAGSLEYMHPAQWLASQQPFSAMNSGVTRSRDQVIFGNGADSEHEVYTGSLDVQGNLMLLGYSLLGWFRNKTSTAGRMQHFQDRDARKDFAHNMAYRAYAPTE